MSFDEELRRALRRKNPPSNFADQVVARLLQKPVAAGLWHQPRLAPGFAVRWVAAAVAASVLIVVGGNRYYSQKQSAAEAERVKQEVKVALQIASEKLNNVREKVQRLSQREF